MNFDVIEQKRKDKNLTVTALCTMAGIDRGTYYNLLEDPKSARWSTICKLARALRLNAAEKSKLL